MCKQKAQAEKQYVFMKISTVDTYLGPQSQASIITPTITKSLAAPVLLSLGQVA